MSFYRFDNSYVLDMMRLHGGGDGLKVGDKVPGTFGGVAIIDHKAPRPQGDLPGARDGCGLVR